MPAAFTVLDRTPKKSSSSKTGAAEGRVTFHPVAAGAAVAAVVAALSSVGVEKKKTRFC